MKTKTSKLITLFIIVICFSFSQLSTINAFADTPSRDSITSQQLTTSLQDAIAISDNFKSIGISPEQLVAVTSLPQKNTNFYSKNIKANMTSNSYKRTLDSKTTTNINSNSPTNSASASDTKPSTPENQAKRISEVWNTLCSNFNNLNKEQFSKQFVYLYISHYIDNPYYYEGYSDFDDIYANNLTQDDYNAYDIFISTGRFSNFVSDITNLSNTLYNNEDNAKTLIEDISKMNDSVGKLISRANAFRNLSNYNADDFAKTTYDTIEAFKDFYGNSPSQDDLLESVLKQVKPHEGYLTDLCNIIVDSLCTVIAGASPLLSAEISLTVIYINMYDDLIKRAALAGLQYSFSGRLAIRMMENM